MRPIIGYGGSNPFGANANNANPRPTIAPHRAYMALRQNFGPYTQAAGPPRQANTPSNPGYNSGTIARNATFKDSSGHPAYNNLGRPIGAMLYKMPFTGPAAIVILRPKIRGISHQVFNPDLHHLQPGWTYTLPVDLNTKIARAMRRPFYHSGP